MTWKIALGETRYIHTIKKVHQGPQLILQLQPARQCGSLPPGLLRNRPPGLPAPPQPLNQPRPAAPKPHAPLALHLPDLLGHRCSRTLPSLAPAFSTATGPCPSSSSTHPAPCVAPTRVMLPVVLRLLLVQLY